ncbi:hypothetical protein QBC34DRAFT_477507 [Podospora aff. communis PSN243]|uniref:Terpene synthase n=1 Tax=Podospora aff. communis PSN243 TaxID=3040156 RepID=A0AAV9G5V1_9PEZI|nr:hypothetical protein QBC34DRAFT_477507 [Podospora aff. communis PSN243]
MLHATRSYLGAAGKSSALDVTTLENLSQQQKDGILAATSEISRKLMVDLGVKWKPQPVDDALRQRTITWIKTELEPLVGPVNKRFLLSTDAGLTYMERVYEGGDFETKASMVKYVTVAIYLDDMIDKNAGMAKEAESFLFKVSMQLARHMSDPFVSNMLLHSCTLYIEGCALEYYVQQDQEKYFLVQDADTERARDEEERMLERERGFDIPLPLDNDRVGPSDSDDDIASETDYLVPHGWPIWLRERSAVAETFAITSFRAPGGIDVPTWLWVTAVAELRTVILSINDLLSFAKELLADDTTSSISVLTKERRMIGMPGSAPDGGWCLRDSFEEVFGKIVVAGARINWLLRPTVRGARYDVDGRVYGIMELVDMLKDSKRRGVDRGEVMKALALRLWETHQRGYVAWHFQSPRYRAHELFDWVGEMMGEGGNGPEWLTECFLGR